MVGGSGEVNGRGEDGRRVVKLVHWTDVHFLVKGFGSGGRFPGQKELMGMAHLYLTGRSDAFDSKRLVGRLVKDVSDLDPDVVVFSGDLTAMGTDAEFETAKRVVKPLLDAFPTVMIAGNHDRYTKGRRLSMENHFSAWMKGGRQNGTHWEAGKDVAKNSTYPAVFDLDSGLKIVAVDQVLVMRQLISSHQNKETPLRRFPTHR